MAPAAASLTVGERDGTTVLTVAGHLDAASAGHIWRQVLPAARRANALSFDLTALEYCDMSGAALLVAAEAAHAKPVVLIGTDPKIGALLQRARVAAAVPPASSAATRFADPGMATAFLDSVAFLGEVAVAVATLPSRARMLRLPDLLRYADQAGVKSIPLVLLLGFLMGLILAFQSAVPMRRFGADLYVANLVAIGLLRELGPLLSAIILAGRTGSAFAAVAGLREAAGAVLRQAESALAGALG